MATARNIKVKECTNCGMLTSTMAMSKHLGTCKKLPKKENALDVWEKADKKPKVFAKMG